MKERSGLSPKITVRYLFGELVPSVLAPVAAILAGSNQVVESFLDYSQNRIPLVCPTTWYGNSFVLGLLTSSVMIATGLVIIWAVWPKLKVFIFTK